MLVLLALKIVRGQEGSQKSGRVARHMYGNIPKKYIFILKSI